MLAAQSDDVGGAVDAPVHAGLFRAVDDDRLYCSFDVAGADEHAQLLEAGVAHPVRVALEVAELLIQFLGLDAFEGVLPGGGDDGLDVAGVELVAAVGEPLARVGGDEGEVVRQVGEVLAGVEQVDDLGGLGELAGGNVPDLIPVPLLSRRSTCRADAGRFV